MIVIEIAERMECGEGSPHSIRSADLCAHFIFSLLFVNIRVYSWLSGHNHKIR
jgi:hypothetical protein